MDLYNDLGIKTGSITTDPDGTVWLVKYVNPLRHKLRTPEGWAVDTRHLRQLAEAGGRGVRLHLTTGTALEAELDLWGTRAFEIDRGHGEQMVLPSKWWTTVEASAQRAARGE